MQVGITAGDALAGIEANRLKRTDRAKALWTVWFDLLLQRCMTTLFIIFIVAKQYNKYMKAQTTAD